MTAIVSVDRYQSMVYRRCGRSGLMLPRISLGLWYNWGERDNLDNARAMTLTAFNHGITHFDLANNYGPPAGAAEETFGRILHHDLSGYRDELVIATKAGYDMWPGPYGNWGSRKSLIASLDQSLKRMRLEYVDIFYHHRPDPETPLEETMGALDHIVRKGKALYAGISRYPTALTRSAAQILKALGTPCRVHQSRYHLLERDCETDLLTTLQTEGIGFLAFSPLFQGILTDQYLSGIPQTSRIAKTDTRLSSDRIVGRTLEKVRRCNRIARQRGQTLAQMAISWVLRNDTVTSALIGASRPTQIEEIVAAIDHIGFDDDELAAIDNALRDDPL
jgi:L-glyceraldehyde 3-phosphate reductase